MYLNKIYLLNEAEELRLSEEASRREATIIVTLDSVIIALVIAVVIVAVITI